ncbi:MAG: AraC family transcriptional regulator [Hyphomicrobiales bacterium]|nr:AraC family transcriptional regulator [Hyphomicrobiales bacterium]
MDTLSEILRTVRLKGGIFLDARFTPSWSVASSITPDDLQPYMKQAEVLCALHYVISGEMYVEVEGEDPLLVKSGELVLLPRNTPHVLSNRPGQRPVPSGDLIQPGDNGGLASIVHGSGSGPLTNLVCGYLANEEMRNPLMATLPPMLKVNVSEGASRDWIESSVRYGAQQLSEGHHATSSVMARLSELLFVEAVRAYSETQEVHEQHWLHGLKDQYLGRALAALHDRLAHGWSVADLAEVAGLSRSAFVERFTAAMGTPPMQYLAKSRMLLAKELLVERQKSISQVAAAVGYDAEAAFNRAFKREFGVPPARWRDQQAAA